MNIIKTFDDFLNESTKTDIIEEESAQHLCSLSDNIYAERTGNKPNESDIFVSVGNKKTTIEVKYTKRALFQHIYFYRTNGEWYCNNENTKLAKFIVNKLNTESKEYIESLCNFINSSTYNTTEYNLNPDTLEIKQTISVGNIPDGIKNNSLNTSLVGLWRKENSTLIVKCEFDENESIEILKEWYNYKNTPPTYIQVDDNFFLLTNDNPFNFKNIPKINASIKSEIRFAENGNGRACVQAYNNLILKNKSAFSIFKNSSKQNPFLTIN